jgi:hypothetical protein
MINPFSDAPIFLSGSRRPGTEKDKSYSFSKRASDGRRETGAHKRPATKVAQSRLILSRFETQKDAQSAKREEKCI